MLKVKEEPYLVFSSTQYNSICRVLASKIEEITIHPHPESVRFVVDKLLAKFPVLIIDKKKAPLTTVIVLRIFMF